MTEQWRPITGWPYQVSNLGRVKGPRGWVLTPRVHTNGYMRVHLCGHGEKVEAYIHRLVCAAFHGPAPLPFMHSDHINGDRADNRAENLRWLTPQDNRSRRAIRRGEGHGNARLTEEDVRRIRDAGFAPGRDARIARELGVSRETVRDARLGKLWRHVA